MWRINPILCTDSYKHTHHPQLPPDAEVFFSYFEARGGDYPATNWFGLQAIIQEHLIGEVITDEDIYEARDVARFLHGGEDYFNIDGWRRIVGDHGGKYPVRIRAVPEGTWVPTSNVLYTMENRDKKLPWLNSHLETMCVQSWYPMGVSTLSGFLKPIFQRYLEQTGSPELLRTRLHDFGIRGTTCMHQAARGGAGHLVHFDGTDNYPAMLLLRDFYGGKLYGSSVPAAEHSTITSWGPEREQDAYENLLRQYPRGLVALPTDSYNTLKAIHMLTVTLRDLVEARDGVLVMRQDSGDPSETMRQVLAVAGQNAGYHLNDKSYRVLNPKYRVLQSEGVNRAEINQMLWLLTNNTWSIDNIVFGMGGALLQKLDRDTSFCACKCSWVGLSDGTGRDVYKMAPGKRSKRGRLKLVEQKGELTTVRQEEAGKDLLEDIYDCGQLLNPYTFDQVRANAEASWRPRWAH